MRARSEGGGLRRLSARPAACGAPAVRQRPWAVVREWLAVGPPVWGLRLLLGSTGGAIAPLAAERSCASRLMWLWSVGPGAALGRSSGRGLRLPLGSPGGVCAPLRGLGSSGGGCAALQRSVLRRLSGGGSALVVRGGLVSGFRGGSVARGGCSEEGTVQPPGNSGEEPWSGGALSCGCRGVAVEETGVAVERAG